MVWLAKRHLDECSLQYRAVWDLYLKFYVMFMTVNGAALGLTVQYVSERDAKAVISLAFLLQNALAGSTALVIAKFTSNTAKKAQELAAFVLLDAVSTTREPLPSALAESMIPGQLGWWAAIANGIAHLIFGVLWFVVILVDFRPQ
jgi:hypothetical protein